MNWTRAGLLALSLVFFATTTQAAPGKIPLAVATDGTNVMSDGSKIQLVKKKEDAEEAAGPLPRFEERGFIDKYFAWKLPEEGQWHPMVEENKWTYLIITLIFGYFSDIWLPLIMWKEKPQVDWGILLKHYAIKYAITMVGIIPLVCSIIWWVVPYVGWFTGWLFVIAALIFWLVWVFFNTWTARIMMLNLFDDFLKHPPEKGGDKGEKAAAKPAPAQVLPLDG